MSALCAWLVGRSYLRGNPWAGVSRRQGDRGTRLQIEKAVPLDQWRAFVGWLLARSASDAAMRTALAAVLLLRESGMRCHEAAAAKRADLRPAEGSIAGLWGELDIVGKGGVARAGPMSQACYAALASHWADRAVRTSPITR